MTVLTENLQEMTGVNWRRNVRFYVPLVEGGFAAAGAIATAVVNIVPDEDGVITTPELLPGRAQVRIDGKSYDFDIPDSPTPVDLAPLLGLSIDYPPPVVLEAQEYAIAAAASAAAVAGAAAGVALSGDTTGATDHAAITAAIGSGNVKVQLAPGLFYVNAPIVLQHRTQLVGAGMAATIIRLTNGVNQSVIKNFVSPDAIVANAEFCKISDLTVDGNKANQTAGHGIDFNSNPGGSAKATNDEDWDTHQYVENVRLLNCKQDGFHADGRSSMVLYNVYAMACGHRGFQPAVDSALTNCVAASSGHEGFFINASSAQLSNCKAFYSGQVSASDGHGFYISFGVGDSLIGCHAQNNWGHGFALLNAKSANLTGCISDANSMTNPGLNVGLDIWQSTGCEIKLVSMDGMGAGNEVQLTALQLRGSSTGNSIDLTHQGVLGSTVGQAISSDSVLTGNMVVVNGQIVASATPEVEVRVPPLLYDSFTAADGTALDSAKWTVTTGGAAAAAATTNGNRGRLTTGATGGYSATDRVYVVSTVSTALKDVEILVRHTYGSSNESYTRYAMRSSATDPQAANSYYLELNQGNVIALSKIVSTAFTNLVSGFVTDYGCASVTTGSVKWIRLRAKGTALAFRIWDDGTPEPAAWSYTTTDSSLTAGGNVSVSMGGGSAAASGVSYIDQFHIYAL